MSRVHGVFVVMLLALAPASAQAQGAFDPQARLAELGLQLPPPAAPVANYVPAVRTGNLLFLAGHGECGTTRQTGKVGAGVTIEDAYASARRVALCLLSTIKAELGDLRKVKRVVRVFGLVNGAPGFTEHPRVINGCSDLLVAVFGDRGRHARFAGGAGSLPFDISVEIEMVVEIESGG